MSAPGLISKGFGPTSVGFVEPSLADIKADHEERYVAELGAVDLDPRSGDIGQDVGIHSGSDDDLWQLAGMLATAQDPRLVTGELQDRLYAQQEVYRKAATPSVGEVTITGTAAAPVTTGDLITSPDGTLVYQVTEDDALVAVTARSTSSSVATGALRANSGNVYVATVGGVTGSGSGPSGTAAYPTTETDGTVTWAFVGPGTAAVTVAIQSSEEGVIAGPAFGLTVLGTPVVGLSGCANLSDVVPGHDIESDEDYRARYFVSISLGAGTIDSILRAMLDRNDVDEAQALENTQHVVDANGLEPHSVEVVVRGPASSVDICTALFGVLPAGTKTNGNTTENIADIRGGLHPVSYTVPDVLPVYLDVTVVADRKLWPSELLASTAARGTGRAKAALLAFGTSKLKDGRDVDPGSLSGAMYADLKDAGFLDAEIKLGLAPNPTETDAIPVNFRQVAQFSSNRTTVRVTYRTP